MIKKLHVLLSIVILTGCVDVSTGQDREQNISVADSIIRSRGEVYFSFPLNNLNPSLAKIISVDVIRNSRVFAYANKAGFQNFLSSNIDFELQPENFLSTRLKSARQIDDVYPSYAEYEKIMQSFALNYSSFCDLQQAGLSVQGRKILMLRISSPSNKERKVPAVLLTSSIHGNELTGYKILLWFIEHLLKNYGKDDQVTKLMDEAEIWINPLANPDGTYFGGDNTVVHAKRFNANDFDLNRNFPDPADGLHPDESEWQAETIVLMNFFKEKNIVLSAGLHTGEEVVNYPWDTWPKIHADNFWYKTIARNYVDLVHQKSRSYMSAFDNGIVNGFYWYRITGGQQDYVNYFLHSREVTIELSEPGMPDSISLVKYWEYNRASLLNYLEQSLFGIKGKVTNAKTGLPLHAKVELLNHDKDNSWVYSDSISGNYYRLLSPGDYTLRVSVPGYTHVVKKFSLQPDEMLEIDFNLEKGKDPVFIYPNPFNREINFLFNNDYQPSQLKITLVDISGRTVFVNTVTVTSGEIKINLPDLPDGTYILKLQSNTFEQEFQVVRMD